MECLTTLIGLRGGCAPTDAVGGVWLDDKVTRNELSAIIDQNDHGTVDDLFIALRSQAVREIADGINAAFAGKYINRTIIRASLIGTTGDKLKPLTAQAVTRGVRFYRCNEWPSVAYRITRLGLIAQVSGSVTVSYYDGITGQVLATDTINAVAGQWAWIDTNRVFRGVRILLIGYDATAVPAYDTHVCPNICYTCPNAHSLNAYMDGYGFTSTVGQVLNGQQLTNNAGGLSVVAALECDSEGWLCSVRQQLSMPLLWKTSELAMEYAVTSSGRANTRTVRDADRLADRRDFYQAKFEASMANALKSLVLPNDHLCFHCNRTSRIVAAIP